ncbi:hypothetical protein Daesc_002405 [Daldinia eschscholtzii]|uniref:Peptidase A2 domain-containing protein n=1 Tax=Daldinia eschscholtzii TaxID=292717 RepID=A0AAX6MWS6_9PEZI
MNEARPDKTISEWASDLSHVAKETIIQSIATNSTAFEECTGNTSKFIGSGTEVALLGFAREHLGMQCLAKIRNSEQIVWSMPFDSRLKYMAVVIKLRTGGYRLLVRGAAEMILTHCIARVEVENGNETQLTMVDQRTLQSTAEILNGPWHQSICLAYRDYQQWPPTGIRAESGDVDLGILVKDLTFLGIFSIKKRNSFRSRMRFQAQARIFEIRGSINGHSVIANADTGASYNIVSERLAKSMNLNIRPQTAGEILLPSGRRLFSRGQVNLQYQFAGEKTIYQLPCVVLPLPTASYDVILGGGFLKVTETCTSHIYRMKRVFSSLGRISLNLIGGQQEFVSGYLNGRECLAVPDTGSDIMVVSRGYAKKLGLKIYKKSHYRSKVQFIDGSKVMTDGIARDVRWQFRAGEAPIRCDFHVIRRLPVRAILSNALIDEFNVFSKYHDRIGQPKSTYDEHCGIFGIALIERCRKEIRSLSESFTEDITSDAPFTPEKVERERARRDEIRDRITKVPEPLRAEEQAREDRRQSQWNDLWRRHREGNTPPPNILSPGQVVSPTPPDGRKAQYTTPLVGVVVDNGNNRRFGHSPHRAINNVPFWIKWWHNRRRL